MSGYHRESIGMLTATCTIWPGETLMYNDPSSSLTPGQMTPITVSFIVLQRPYDCSTLRSCWVGMEKRDVLSFCVYTACFPNDAWTNLKDNNKKNHTSKSKFSCFLQNTYCYNSCNVNHWNNITVIIKKMTEGNHSSLTGLIWDPERWQIMPSSSWQMIRFKNHLLKRTCFKFHELIKYF